jgi:hypothetical protein
MLSAHSERCKKLSRCASQVAGNYHFRIPDAKITGFASTKERRETEGSADAKD